MQIVNLFKPIKRRSTLFVNIKCYDLCNFIYEIKIYCSKKYLAFQYNFMYSIICNTSGVFRRSRMKIYASRGISCSSGISLLITGLITLFNFTSYDDEN